jgi:hypothetical protein
VVFGSERCSPASRLRRLVAPDADRDQLCRLSVVTAPLLLRDSRQPTLGRPSHGEQHGALGRGIRNAAGPRFSRSARAHPITARNARLVTRALWAPTVPFPACAMSLPTAKQRRCSGLFAEFQSTPGSSTTRANTCFRRLLRQRAMRELIALIDFGRAPTPALSADVPFHCGHGYLPASTGSTLTAGAARESAGAAARKYKEQLKKSSSGRPSAASPFRVWIRVPVLPWQAWLKRILRTWSGESSRSTRSCAWSRRGLSTRTIGSS